MEVVVIQFPLEWLDSLFRLLPETQQLRTLCLEAQRGLFFPASAEVQLGPKLIALMKSTGFTRYHLLLDVLHDMSMADHRQLLATERYTPTLGQESEDRIGVVCRHIHEHFRDPIQLDVMSDLAQMSPTAFCRFFKKMTGKTLSNYMIDLRISHACSLLLEKRQTISEVAYESGFNSITHFNRSFKSRKEVTPKVYRQKIRTLI